MRSFRPASALLLSFLALAACSTLAQELEQPVTPSIILPQGVPRRSKLSQWKPAAGRALLSLNRGDAVLRGYLYNGANPKAPTAIFFNGSGQLIAENDAFYRNLAGLGPSLAVYDYAGYGYSSGNPDVMETRADSLKIYDQVADQAPGHRVVVYGYSMGTVMASFVASQRTPAAVVLAAPIANAREWLSFLAEQQGMGVVAASQLRISSESTEAFGEASLLSKYLGPLLVIHGSTDSTIPFAQGKEVFAASPSKSKYFIQIKGADHEGLPLQRGALQSFSRFVALVQQPAPASSPLPAANP
jgi:uncharacterized protein